MLGAFLSFLGPLYADAHALGDPSFEAREAAHRRLVASGEKALLPVLLCGGGNPESLMRRGHILRCVAPAFAGWERAGVRLHALWLITSPGPTGVCRKAYDGYLLGKNGLASEVRWWAARMGQHGAADATYVWVPYSSDYEDDGAYLKYGWDDEAGLLACLRYALRCEDPRKRHGAESEYLDYHRQCALFGEPDPGGHFWWSALKKKE